MSDMYERQSNYGLYEAIVKDVSYAVKARNGSLIPAVSFQKFQIIHADLPKKLWYAQNWQASELVSHFDGGCWRFSHNNQDGDLPEWEIGTLKFAQEGTRNLDETQHRFQQFQEIDVRAMLGIKGDSASKETADPGAMRVVVDECFEHVYFTLNHYRDIVVNKHLDAVNPWILVLYDTLFGGWETTTDKAFQMTNITEASTGPSGKVQAKFGNLKVAVTLIKPKAIKRQRRSSYTFTMDTSGGAQVMTYTAPKTD